MLFRSDRFMDEVNRKIRQTDKKNIKADFKAADETLRGVKDKINPQKQNYLKAAKAEEALIAILLEHPDYFEFVHENISSGEFVTDFNRRVFEYIVSRIENNLSLDLTMFSKGFSPDEMSRITAMTVKAKIYCIGTKEELFDYINVIKTQKEKISKDIKTISSEELREQFKKLSGRK